MIRHRLRELSIKRLLDPIPPYVLLHRYLLVARRHTQRLAPQLRELRDGDVGGEGAQGGAGLRGREEGLDEVAGLGAGDDVGEAVVWGGGEGEEEGVVGLLLRHVVGSVSQLKLGIGGGLKGKGGRRRRS